jgi:hypothetical protein
MSLCSQNHFPVLHKKGGPKNQRIEDLPGHCERSQEGVLYSNSRHPASIRCIRRLSSWPVSTCLRRHRAGLGILGSKIMETEI